jgi:hypothetical protein
MQRIEGCAGHLVSNWQRKLVLISIVFALGALAMAQSNSAQTYSVQTSPSPAPQASSAQVDPKTVPVIDGGVGPCSADITIIDANGAPVYAAKVTVHIAYGWMNVRKLDLEAGTNVDGKVRFMGIPDRIKHGIYFYASEGNRTGEAFDDPANTCKAQFGITIRQSDSPKAAGPSGAK